MEINLKDRDKLIDCTAEVIDGVFVVSPKEEAWPKFPTTVDECLEVLGHNAFILDSMNGYKAMKLMTLQALLTCRDAYWKIAGDWKPDWTNYGQKKHSIEVVRDNIGFYDASEGNLVLVFPTAEMRDVFYENFKDLIECCKELL